MSAIFFCGIWLEANGAPNWMRSRVYLLEIQNVDVNGDRKEKGESLARGKKTADRNLTFMKEKVSRSRIPNERTRSTHEKGRQAVSHHLLILSNYFYTRSLTGGPSPGKTARLPARPS
jgi:hypothetical protein